MRFWLSFALVLMFLSLGGSNTALANGERRGCGDQVENGPGVPCEERCQEDFQRNWDTCEELATQGHDGCEGTWETCRSACGGDTSCQDACEMPKMECKRPVYEDLHLCLEQTKADLEICAEECPCGLCPIKGQIATDICMVAADVLMIVCDIDFAICLSGCGQFDFVCQGGCLASFLVCEGVALGLEASCVPIGEEITRVCLEEHDCPPAEPID